MTKQRPPAAAFLLALALSAQAETRLSVNSGHGKGCAALALSADKAYIASAGNDLTVRVWQRESGRLVRVLSFGEAKGGEELRDLLISPDGAHVAARSGAGRFRLWRVEDGKLIVSNAAGEGSAAAVPGVKFLGAAFSPSGRLAAVAVAGWVGVYDLATASLVGESRPAGFVLDGQGMGFFGEDRLGVMGIGEGRLHLYELPSMARREKKVWNEPGRLRIGRGLLYFLYPDKLYAMDPLADEGPKQIRAWESLYDATLHIDEGRGELYALELRTLYRLGPGGKEKVLEFSKLPGDEERYAKRLFDPESGVSVVGLQSGEILVSAPWSGATAPLNRAAHRVRSLEASGGLVVLGFDEGGGAVWDLGRLKGIYLRPGRAGLVNGSAISPDGSKAALGGVSGTFLYDARSGELLGSQDKVSCFDLEFAPSGGLLALGESWYGALELYDPAKGMGVLARRVGTHQAFDPITKAPTSSKGCYALAYSPDGSAILSTGADSIAKLWDARSGQRLWASGPPGEASAGPYCAAFSRGGELFATERRVWEASTKKVLAELRPEAEVRAIAFSPSGEELYLGCRTGRVEVRAARGGELLGSFAAHEGEVRGLGFARVGGRDILATAGLDGALRLWLPGSRELVLTGYVFQGGDWALVAPDGYWDASAKGGSLVNMVEGRIAYGIDQFAARTNRPDILAERLGAPPELAALFRERHEARLRKLGLGEAAQAAEPRVPKSRIASVKREGRFALLELAFESAGPGLASYQVYANDVPLLGSPGKGLSGRSASASERVELVPGRNKLELSCLDRSGAESYRAQVLLDLEEPAAPDLYYVGLGVARYADRAIPDLAYPAKDALALAGAFAAMKGRPFREVRTLVLGDGKVTRKSLEAIGRFAAPARPGDLFVLFIAGHGIQLESGRGGYEYYYVTGDSKLATIQEKSIPFAELEALVSGVAPRQKLFLIDTCQSGEADRAPAASLAAAAAGARARVIPASAARGLALVPGPAGEALADRDRFIWNDLARRSGAVVFSACRADEASYESDAWKQGAFTSAILEAFASKAADRDGDGSLSADELRAYVSAAVPRKLRSLDPRARQHPVVDRDNLYASFSFPAAR
ncbi:MAG TPA: caspase family protein [Spirochaetia bacterium]|nr:caspase family protein [Spirochaetia bacterium]HRZ64305.1 caspase family protein [Spirochaetia bacterium]